MDATINNVEKKVMNANINIIIIGGNIMIELVPFIWDLFKTDMEAACQVVRAQDLKSGDPKFKFCSDHQLDLFQVVPGSTQPWLSACT